MTIRLILISNRNARNSTRYFDINFYFNISFSNICTVLTTLRYSCINNNTSSTINFCCSVTSIDIINFSLARVAYFSTLLVSSSRSIVLCTLKVTQRRFIKSIYLRKTSLLTCCILICHGYLIDVLSINFQICLFENFRKRILFDFKLF